MGERRDSGEALFSSDWVLLRPPEERLGLEGRVEEIGGRVKGSGREDNGPLDSDLRLSGLKDDEYPDEDPISVSESKSLDALPSLEGFDVFLTEDVK